MPERRGAAQDIRRLVPCTPCRMSSLLKNLASSACSLLSQMPRRQTGKILRAWKVLVKAFWLSRASMGLLEAHRKLQRNPLAHLQEVACALHPHSLIGTSNSAFLLLDQVRGQKRQSRRKRRKQPRLRLRPRPRPERRQSHKASLSRAQAG